MSSADLAVVCALPEEAGPLVGHWGLRPARIEGLPAWRGECPGGSVLMVRAGAGAAAAPQGLDRALASASEVLFTGLAGALTPDLATGDRVLAAALAGAALPRVGGHELADPRPERRQALLAAGAREGVFVTSPTIVARARDKRELGARFGAGETAVVDMESGRWAALANRAEVPYVVLRVVSDTLDESLPGPVARAVDRRGRLSRGRVLAAALARPWTVPALVEFRARARGLMAGLARTIDEVWA